MSQLNYTDQGTGFPLVFIHGFCEDLTMWKELADVLAVKYRVICIDLPGFGKSSLDNPDFGLEDTAAIINDLLEEEGVDSCVMVGHSLGGYITMAFAELFPQRLAGLGLFHSTAFGDTAFKSEKRSKAMDFVREFGMSPYIKEFVPSLFYAKNFERLQERINSQIEIGVATDAESMIAYANAMNIRPDRSETLRDFSGKVLLIIGKKDASIPLEESQRLIALREDASSLVLKKAAHMGMFEKTEKTIAILEEFMSQF